MASPPYQNFQSNSCLPSSTSCVLWRQRKVSASHDYENGMKQTEEMLSNELSKLSMKERSEAYDDVHCVGGELQETPEMIEKSLLEFDQAIPKYRNEAYDKACAQNKAYVEDPSFRLKFLRAQIHNVDKAVPQMMKFLKYKGEYFGEDKLGRDITLADLSQDDIELMLSGLFHIQAERDRMGRVVVYALSKSTGRFKPESTFRVCYYIWFNILLSLPDVQMKGLVEMYLDIPRPEEEDLLPENDPSFHKSMDAGFSIPYRNSAHHFLLNTGGGIRSRFFENSLTALIVSMSSLHTKVRTRIHYGTILELQYKLGSYGIPMDAFPVAVNGKLREDIMNAWFYEHLVQEGITLLPSDGSEGYRCPKFHFPGAGLTEASHLSPSSTVASMITPSDTDVLAGRGRLFQIHPGNVQFRMFLEDYSDEYDKLDRRDKMVLSINLTNILIERNVRFLKQTTSGEWVILDLKEARMKVSQHFRTRRKMNRKP